MHASTVAAPTSGGAALLRVPGTAKALVAATDGNAGVSAADPWHILPMATIITILWLQQITPRAGMYPAQRRMMNVMMPLTLGAITWTVGAGLAPYRSVSNVINGSQQFAINRTSLGREIREIQEKRARKRNR